jgi:hypothetical protein
MIVEPSIRPVPVGSLAPGRQMLNSMAPAGGSGEAHQSVWVRLT